MIGLGPGIHLPQRILSLSLRNTASQSNAWYRGSVVERRAGALKGGMDSVWEMTNRFRSNDAFVEGESTTFQEVREVLVRTSIPGYLAGISAVAYLDYLDSLHKITAPTRIIAAGADPVTPVERSEEICDRVPDA